MKCDICAILENKDAFKFIYEDEQAFAILHESPAVPGHCLVIPKEHATIVEELDDKIAEHLFIVANKVSTALFEAVGAHGTNILLNNGHEAGQELPHVVVNVLPRQENDGIDFEWEPHKAEDSALQTTKSMLSSIAGPIYSGKDKLPEVKVKSEEPDEPKPKKSEDDYLVKSLRRTP